jgi:hypothetical protein
MINGHYAQYLPAPEQPGVIQMHYIIVNFQGDCSDIYAGGLMAGRKRDKEGVIRDTIRKPRCQVELLFRLPK